MASRGRKRCHARADCSHGQGELLLYCVDVPLGDLLDYVSASVTSIQCRPRNYLANTAIVDNKRSSWSDAVRNDNTGAAAIIDKVGNIISKLCVTNVVSLILYFLRS